MSIEQLTMKTNYVIWKNINLPLLNQTVKSPVFCFDGLICHFEVLCSQLKKEYYVFNIKTPNDPQYVCTRIIIPFLKTAQKYVRLAASINTCVYKSFLPSSIGSENITVLFLFTPESSMPLDFEDEAEKVDLDQEKEYLCLGGLSEDIVQLFNKDGYADATVKCGNKSFSVHRNILAARSTVFSSMFENDIIEKRTGIVEIVDLDPNILEQFLVYIYSGKVNDICMESALKLYKAADKYAVYSLRKLCASYILEYMSKDMICNVLLLADEAEDLEFLNSVASSVARIPGFLNSSEWEEFTAKFPALAVKVYSIYIKSNPLQSTT